MMRLFLQAGSGGAGAPERQPGYDSSRYSSTYPGINLIFSLFLYYFHYSRQIQEVLVSLKDKEASFIGSNKWIGAIELSYILDEYLGVTSKVRWGASVQLGGVEDTNRSAFFSNQCT
jgi:hypothetical protein